MCSRWADTGEAVNEVDAGSSVKAGLRMAFIDLVLTVHPLVAWLTLIKYKRRGQLMAQGTQKTNVTEMQWTDLQCTHMCPDSLCMLLRCDMDLICTRQPSLCNNFPYILAGTHICGNYPHSHNGRHSYTHFPLPSLFFIQENTKT